MRIRTILILTMVAAALIIPNAQASGDECEDGSETCKTWICWGPYGPYVSPEPCATPIEEPASVESQAST